jgi:hypothetical protein
MPADPRRPLPVVLRALALASAMLFMVGVAVASGSRSPSSGPDGGADDGGPALRAEPRPTYFPATKAGPMPLPHSFDDGPNHQVGQPAPPQRGPK